METKVYVPEVTSPVSSVLPGSSSFVPIRASPSYDSDIEIQSNDNELKNFHDKGSTSSEEDEDGGGFVSGNDEFETALERPFVPDTGEETLENGMDKVVGDDDEETFVEPFEEISELPRAGMPIAKVSSDDDDDEEDEAVVTVETSKGRVLGGEEESLVGESDSGSIVSNTNEAVLVKENSSEVVGAGDVETVEEAIVEKLVDEASVDEEIKSNLNETVEKGDVGEIEEATVDKLVVESDLNEPVMSKADVGTEEATTEKLVIEAASDEQVKVTEAAESEEATIEKFMAEGALEEKIKSISSEVVAKSGVEEIEEATVVKSMPESALDEQVKVQLSEVVEESADGGSDEGKAEKLVVDGGDEVLDNSESNESKGSTTVQEVFSYLKHLVSSNDSKVEKEIQSENVPDTVKADESVNESPIVGGAIEESESKTVEPETDEFFDSIVEDSVETSKDSKKDEVEVSSIDETPKVNGVYDPIEEPADLKSVEPETGKDTEGVENLDQTAVKPREINEEAEDEEGEIEGLQQTDEEDTEGMIFGSSEAAKKFMEELEQQQGSSQEQSQRIDGQIFTDSDEEADTDEEGEGKQLFDSAALAALLRAATGAGSDDGSNITITSQDGSRLFTVERPAGLGSTLRSANPPAPRPNRSNLFAPTQITTGSNQEVVLSEEDKKKLENIQLLRVKFLRLVQRLGHSAEDTVAAQILYRLSLVAGRLTPPIFSLGAAKETALKLEAEGKDDLDFSLNILVLGKSGVGKSATINSIFGEEKTSIDAFDYSTTSVKEIVGVVDGVKIRVFDTPGLKSSVMEQAGNSKTLSYIKRFTKKCPPDIVLYVDRLDTQTRDLNDLPLLRTITSSLGPSIWRSTIITLTHGASAPPDGPSGSPLSYEVFVAQRSHIVQQSIGQAVGDLRMMNPSLMNPFSLVENHPSCRKTREGHKVLPNGQTWRPQLLLLCYAMKILSEANSLSKPDAFDHRKLFGFRGRSPPLPYLLSWLLQSRTHPKLPSDQGADVDSDVDLDDVSDSEVDEDGDEYDQLPPFKPLKKSQLAKLNKEQKKAYFEEYDYRVKLLQKKQWREELKRMRESKKREKMGSGNESGYLGDDVEQEDGGPAAVPVPLPDMALPPSFDSDNPAYRYRFLEPTSQLLMRPVLDTHGWDHDCGYDGVNLEQTLAIASRFPGAIAVQITKDKKEFNIHLDSSVSAKHGENNSTMAGFDIQNVGKQLAYILRGETKLKIIKRNTTSAGFSITFLGENVATGFKLEDQVSIGKRLVLVGSTGTVRSQNDAAYGANVEVRLRESDYPIGQDQSTLGLSLVKWRGDLALGANLQSQFSIGRSSKMAVRVGLNNKMSGQITVRTTSSDQLQIALMGIIPVVVTLYKNLWPGVGENY